MGEGWRRSGLQKQGFGKIRTDSSSMTIIENGNKGSVLISVPQNNSLDDLLALDGERHDNN